METRMKSVGGVDGKTFLSWCIHRTAPVRTAWEQKNKLISQNEVILIHFMTSHEVGTTKHIPDTWCQYATIPLTASGAKRSRPGCRRETWLSHFWRYPCAAPTRHIEGGRRKWSVGFNLRWHPNE